MDNDFVDFYEMLGLKRNSDLRDLDFKYQEIMKFLSPDSHPGKTYSDNELRELQEQRENVYEAYQTLRYKESKALYDAYYDKYQEAAKQSKKRNKRVERHSKPLSVPPVLQQRVVSSPQPSREVRTPRSEPPLREAKPPKNNRPVERNHSKREKDQKEGFFQSIRRQYREVRQDERSDSLRMRHRRLTDSYEEAFLNGVTNVPKEILYYTGKGLSHVTFEMIYQLAKLRYINKDEFTKFMIRNRRLIAAGTLVGVMFSSGLIGGTADDAERAPEVFPIYEPAEPTPAPVAEEHIPSYEPRVVLNRHYTIVAGDTLSRLSYDANSSISELKQVNGYETDQIYYGRKMWIPYTIDREDLEYYTENVKVNDYSLEELARVYETDVETIHLLNPESVIKTGNNSYFILSDSLLVPHFATKQEVAERKQANSYH